MEALYVPQHTFVIWHDVRQLEAIERDKRRKRWSVDGVAG
jgi:hypothetical protein